MAVASGSQGRLTRGKMADKLYFLSGEDVALSNPPYQASHGESGLEESFDQHYRTNSHHCHHTILGLLLGQSANMVRDHRCVFARTMVEV